MQNKQDFMKTKPVFPLLLSMAAPMVLSMLIQSLYNIVDSIFVARLGTEALTAVSLVYPLQNIVLSLSVGVGVGINSVIARRLGEQKAEEANKAASIGMGLTFLHCILIILSVCWQRGRSSPSLLLMNRRFNGPAATHTSSCVSPQAV